MDLDKLTIEIISTKYSVKRLAKKVKTFDPDKSYNYSIYSENETNKHPNFLGAEETLGKVFVKY